MQDYALVLPISFWKLESYMKSNIGREATCPQGITPSGKLKFHVPNSSLIMNFVYHLQLLKENTHTQDNNKFDKYFLQQVSFTQIKLRSHASCICFIFVFFLWYERRYKERK